MMNKNQQNQSTDEQDLNRELISTVTATVLQTLKETGQTSGEVRNIKTVRPRLKLSIWWGCSFTFWKERGLCC